MKKPSHGFATALPPLALAALCVGLQLAGATAARAADSFIESDDYKDGEEIVGVFLKDDDYRIMAEDFERRGQNFDWGWVLTPRWEQKAAASSADDGGGKKKGLLGRLRGSSGPSLENEPGELAFDITSFKTVYIPEVKNFAGIIKPDELAEVREAFVLGMEQLGLAVVDSAQGADLELSTAVVDINREGAQVGWIRVEPFIEVELRLRDLAGDRDLLLIRNQEHADTPGKSAIDYANQLVLFLR